MLLIVDENTRPVVEAAVLYGHFAVARKSWAHLSDERALEVRQYRLDFTSWQKVAAAFINLLPPETCDEAALICPQLCP
jgi:hypothetical protein